MLSLAFAKPIIDPLITIPQISIGIFIGLIKDWALKMTKDENKVAILGLNAPKLFCNLKKLKNVNKINKI